MEACIKNFLVARGYTVNTDQESVISMCDDWYSNRPVTDFHRRRTVQGVEYDLHRLNFAKRCCADDANLCEVVEVNAGKQRAQYDFIVDLLESNRFDTMYRRQLERTSAVGTVACYVRLEDATLLDNNQVTGGRIRLNYVDASGYYPLTVDNDEVIEACFCGSGLRDGKKESTLVLFRREDGLYTAETHYFNEHGSEVPERASMLQLGDVKPFAVMRNAEVNNLDNMTGYGLPKLYNAIPMLKALDLCYNVLFGDLSKADKLLLVNELMCDMDDEGRPRLNKEQKEGFVFLGEKLPAEKDLIQEYNPVIRIEEITKAFELNLSLLSMSFGYGTKKYSFENGQITTATEYIGERQDQAQELNRQRKEAEEYITSIVRAALWFANTFQGGAWSLDEEVTIEFDDSFVTDKQTELESLRADALSFADIPVFKVQYVMMRMNCTEEEAKAYIAEGQALVEEEEPEETED